MPITEGEILFWFLGSFFIICVFFVVAILAIIIFNKPVNYILWSKMIRNIKRSTKL